ncbi:DUF6968 family protein [Rudaea sp.]|uniref:DUF6968 family protein n=1 Tax=Rudaea sp. TaxID=2136325 RepID=UPI0039C97389
MDAVAASRVWVAVDPEGIEHEIVLRVGVPSLQPRGEWLAEATLDGLEKRSHRIAGVDAWQAVGLAMSFIASQVEDFESRDWRFSGDMVEIPSRRQISQNHFRLDDPHRCSERFPNHPRAQCRISAFPESAR